MSKQFVATIKKISGLRTELFRAHSSFRAFEVIQEMRAPNIIGKSDASRNADAIGHYKGFLNVAEHSMNTEFLVALAKLYDEHPEGTSLPKLLNYIRSNINHITFDDFVEYNKTAPDLDIRKADYVGIKEEDLKEAEKIIASLSSQIGKLKILRDKRIAHLELKNLEGLQDQAGPKNIKYSETKIEDLTYSEILTLIEKADLMLNNISSLINKDIADFTNLKETVTQDSEQLIKLLRKTYDTTPSG